MKYYFLIITLYAFQIKAQEEACLLNAEITVTADEIQLSSENYQIRKDRNRNYILFYPENEKHSFWYRITVLSDCRFAFKINSADSLNSGKFYLYKNPELGNFCNDLKKKKIIPARSGGFLEEKTNGAIIYSSGRKKEESSFIQPVTATKGEVYYLNIRHPEETLCGHYLSLIVSSEVVSFRATYPNCIETEKNASPSHPPAQATVEEKKQEIITAATNKVELPLDKKLKKEDDKAVKNATAVNEDTAPKNISEISISTPGKSTFKRNITQVTVSGTILDSITQKPLQAELKWTDEITGKEITAHTNPQGEYSIVLDEKVIYKLSCNTVGYREKTTKFIRQNLNSDAMKQDFAMSTLKPGENFILRHIYFYAGTYAMKPESQPELDKLYAFLSSHEKVKIEIQGHTNGEGKVKRTSNKEAKKKEKGEGWDFHGNEKKLSKYRAEAIKNYLLKKGIVQDRVIAEGMGATRMIYPEPKNHKEKEANRRVEVYILSSNADLASVLNAISE